MLDDEGILVGVCEFPLGTNGKFGGVPDGIWLFLLCSGREALARLKKIASEPSGWLSPNPSIAAGIFAAPRMRQGQDPSFLKPLTVMAQLEPGQSWRLT